MAGGTDGQIITYDASGDPIAVGPGTDGQVLTSTGAGSPPAFENIPASGISDVVSDTSPQLGGTLDCNGQDVQFKSGGGNVKILFDASDDSFEFADNSIAKFGTGDDAFIKHTGSDFLIENDTGSFNLKCTSGTGAGEGIIYFGSGTGTTRLVLQSDGHLRPYADNAYWLGTSMHRWANVYTADLNLSNEGSSNDFDGTWGSWSIQEGESDLFLKNNRSGKKYKFNLTEVT